MSEKRDNTWILAGAMLCIILSIALEGRATGSFFDFVRGLLLGASIALNLGYLILFALRKTGK